MKTHAKFAALAAEEEVREMGFYQASFAFELSMVRLALAKNKNSAAAAARDLKMSRQAFNYQKTRLQKKKHYEKRLEIKRQEQLALFPGESAAKKPVSRVKVSDLMQASQKVSKLERKAGK